MPAEHQSLDWEDQSLGAQNDGVHHADGVNDVQVGASEDPQLLLFQPFVVIGVLGERTAASCPSLGVGPDQFIHLDRRKVGGQEQGASRSARASCSPHVGLPKRGLAHR